jgi:signal transduction histidine kinase
MHDVVAHSLTAMTVQASAAQRVLHRDPASAEQLLDGVQRAGRTALGELRRVLDVLGGDGVPAALAPQPGTADLEALLEQVRAAGLPVVLEQRGTPVPLDPGVDLAAYRVVQESLTNALKHAGPAQVRVVLRWEGDRLDIRVEDDGRGAVPAAAGPGTGRGLSLLRQRTDAYGGTLTAGPRTGGGFALAATLPVSAP